MYLTPPGAAFQARLLGNQEGANAERSVFLRKAFGEINVSSADHLGHRHLESNCAHRFRAWEVGRGVCGAHRPTQYGNHLRNPVLLPPSFVRFLCAVPL